MFKQEEELFSSIPGEALPNRKSDTSEIHCVEKFNAPAQALDTAESALGDVCPPDSVKIMQHLENDVTDDGIPEEDNVDRLKTELQEFNDYISRAFIQKYASSGLPPEIIDMSPTKTLWNPLDFLEKYGDKYPRERLTRSVRYIMDIKLQFFYIMEVDIGLYNQNVHDAGYDSAQPSKSPILLLKRMSYDQNLIMKSRILWERLMNFVYYLDTGEELENKITGKKSKKTVFFNFVEQSKDWNFLSNIRELLTEYDNRYRTPECHKGSMLRRELFNPSIDANKLLAPFNAAINVIWQNVILIISGQEPRHFYGSQTERAKSSLAASETENLLSVSASPDLPKETSKPRSFLETSVGKYLKLVRSKKGNCLYDAVSLYLGKNVQSLRNLIATTLKDNIQKYRDFIKLPPGKTIEDYIEDIRSSNEWAVDLEISILIDLLNRPIISIDLNASIVNPEVLNQSRGEPIFVYYNNINDYDGLVLHRGRTAKETLDYLLQRKSQGEIRGLISQETLSTPSLLERINMLDPTLEQQLEEKPKESDCLHANELKKSLLDLYNAHKLKFQQMSTKRYSLTEDDISEIEASIASHPGCQVQ